MEDKNGTVVENGQYPEGADQCERHGGDSLLLGHRFAARLRATRARVNQLLVGVDEVSASFALHELVFLSAALLAASLLPPYQGSAYPTWHVAAPGVIDASWRWDSQWYASIATEGYRQAAGGYQNTAFFPLFPLLMRASAAPWGLAALPYLGALIPRLAFFVALVYLYRLAKRECNRVVAARTILYVSIYPAALFFSAAYSESLFLLTLVACFFHARSGNWWRAGIWGALATLTRLQGILLIIPLLCEIWGQRRAASRPVLLKAIAVMILPTALFGLMLFLRRAVGDPIAFLSAQSAWHRGFSMPQDTLISAVSMAIAGEPDAMRHAMGILNTAATLVFGVLTLLTFRRLPVSYAIFALAYLTVPLLSPVPDMPTVSMARFTSVLFPAFIVLAEWGRCRHLHHAILVASVTLFSILTALFVNWYWVV